MKKYTVIIEESAQADVERSYDWGRRVWGKVEAQKWVRDLRTAIMKLLTRVPTAFPPAPESDEFQEEIRQLIVGRYRVLFTVRGRRVHVLHVRGSYVRSMESGVGDE